MPILPLKKKKKKKASESGKSWINQKFTIEAFSLFL